MSVICQPCDTSNLVKALINMIFLLTFKMINELNWIGYFISLPKKSIQKVRGTSFHHQY